MQKIIFATRFGAAAAHFESAKRMPPDDRACARAINVNVAGLESRFHALDVVGAAGEKAAGQRVVGSVCDLQRFVEIAHF